MSVYVWPNRQRRQAQTLGGAGSNPAAYTEVPHAQEDHQDVAVHRCDGRSTPVIQPLEREHRFTMKFDRHKRRRNSGVFQVCAATAPATGAPQGPRRFESGAAHRDEAPLAFRLLVPLHAWHNDES